MKAAVADLCRQLGLEASESQLSKLADFLAQLQRWNATFNLTAVRDPAQMLVQHLADCLAALPALDRHCAEGRVLDVGSGGGLPGVVFAILRPALDVTCIDAVGKKAAFVRQVAGLLGLANLHAAHGRVEQLKAPPFGLITARAFASLPELVRLTRPLLAPGGCWMAMKGRVPEDELAGLPAEIEMFHVEPIQVPGLDAQRCLVWMRPRPAAAG